MKKLLFISLTLISFLLLSACSEAKLDPKYESLINAIENGDYADARQELDKLMSNSGAMTTTTITTTTKKPNARTIT